MTAAHQKWLSFYRHLRRARDLSMLRRKKFLENKIPNANLCPFQTKITLKTIPFRASHAHIAHIWWYPLGDVQE